MGLLRTGSAGRLSEPAIRDYITQLLGASVEVDVYDSVDTLNTFVRVYSKTSSVFAEVEILWEKIRDEDFSAIGNIIRDLCETFEAKELERQEPMLSKMRERRESMTYNIEMRRMVNPPSPKPKKLNLNEKPAITRKLRF